MDPNAKKAGKTASAMAPKGPMPAPAAPMGAGGMDIGAAAGGPPPTPYGQLHGQLSQMPPPDPTTFLKLLWDHILSPHQKDLVTAMLQDPSKMQPGGGAAAGLPTGAAGTPPTQ